MAGSCVTVLKNQITQNQQFINQLLESLKKEEFILHFKDNIWGADLADMQLISKNNKGIRFLLCVIDILANMHGLFL